jgi:hypothetical protein
LLLGGVAFLAISSFIACGEPSVPDDLPGLILIMGSNDMNAGQAAGRKVEHRYGETGLLQVLREGNGAARGRAARWLAIGKHQSPETIAALVQASQDHDDFVRGMVAYGLGELGDANVLPTIKLLEADSSKSVAAYARNAREEIELRTNLPAKQRDKEERSN